MKIRFMAGLNAIRRKKRILFPAMANSTGDAQLKKLEKENRELREELEILKKMAVYFAKNLK